MIHRFYRLDPMARHAPRRGSPVPPPCFLFFVDSNLISGPLGPSWRLPPLPGAPRSTTSGTYTFWRPVPSFLLASSAPRLLTGLSSGSLAAGVVGSLVLRPQFDSVLIREPSHTLDRLRLTVFCANLLRGRP